MTRSTQWKRRPCSLLFRVFCGVYTYMLYWCNDPHSVTGALSQRSVFGGNVLSVLAKEPRLCIKDRGKVTVTLSDLVTITILYADIGDRTQDTALESQCSTT